MENTPKKQETAGKNAKWEMKMTPTKLLIALFLIVILAVPIVTIALPKQERSENENRTLAKFPTLLSKDGDIKWDYITVRDKPSFMDDIETYFADHLAGRELWVSAKNKMEKAIGKQEISGVYTYNGNMIQVFKEYDAENVQNSLEGISIFAERFPDVPMYFMLDPTAQELYYSELPSYAGYLSQKTFIDNCYSSVSGVTAIDGMSNILSHKGEYLFYRTDHHWTSLGAYYAYAAAAKALGYTAYGMDEFNIETASSNFRGTLYSKTLDNGVTPDSIDYYHLRTNAPEITMTVFDGTKETVYDSLYVRSYLDVKDKYSSFTGSNQPIVTIETNVDNDKSLLLIKDSYAHSLVPFLANHYSKITMVDMRYINVGLDYFLDVEDYSQVLLTFNVVSFSEDNSLAKLRLTKPKAE